MSRTRPPLSQVDPTAEAGAQIGRAIASSRLRHELTQVDLALRCGISLRTLSKIESGNTSVSWCRVLRVAEQLGCLDAVTAAFAGRTPRRTSRSQR